MRGSVENRLSFPRWHHFPEPEGRNVGRKQDGAISIGFCSHLASCIAAVFSNQVLGITGHLGWKPELALLVNSPKEKWLEWGLLPS